MAEPIQLLDVVALTADRPQDGLRRGQVGTAVEELAVDTFLVRRDDVDHAPRSGSRRHLRVVHDVVGREQLGCELVLAPVVHLLVEATYDGLGLR